MWHMPDEQEQSRPSTCTHRYWIYAYEPSGRRGTPSEDGGGKWLVFVPAENVDQWWESGDLRLAYKTSTATHEGRYGKGAALHRDAH